VGAKAQIALGKPRGPGRSRGFRDKHHEVIPRWGDGLHRLVRCFASRNLNGPPQSFPASSGVLQQDRGLSVPPYWNIENFESARFKLPFHEGQHRRGIAFFVTASQ